MSQDSNKCPVCNGYKSESQTTFTVDLGFGVVVIRHVPAVICQQCGTEWIDDDTSEKLEGVVAEAKRKHAIIEVSEYSNIQQAIAS